MKRILLVAFSLTLIFVEFVFGQQWVVQTSNTTQDLKSISFGSSAFGVAVGMNGAIVSTNNTGTTWSPQTSGVSSNLFGVFCLNTTQVWAVGLGGTIIASTDGGASWVPQTSGTSSTLYDVFFVSATTGWVVGSNGVILYTSNGGTTWSQQTSGTSEILNAIHFYSATEGWIAGNDNTILYTTDQGATWNSQVAAFGSYRDIYFLDDQKGWAVGGGGGSTVITTNNGGQTWTLLPYGFTPLLNSVVFVSPTTGWMLMAVATTGYGSIRHSIDGGVSWTIQNTPVPVALEDLHFINSTNGFAVGNSGIILKYTSPVGISEANISEIQIFPNPAKGFFTISNIVEESEIKIYDLKGKLVFIGHIDYGNYMIPVNENWNGIFIVQISGKSDTRRLKLSLN